MKPKKLLYMLIIAMLMLSFTAIGNNVSAAPETIVYATDHEYVTEADLVSNRFNVTVGIQDVNDWGAWEFKLGYNTSLLDAEYVYKTPDTSNNTDWVPVDGMGTWWPDREPTINDTAGYVWCGALIPVALGQGLHGDFEMLKIRFHIILAPPYGYSPPAPPNITYSCDLHLYDVVIGDSYGASITVTLDDGLYSYTRPQRIPGRPVASFTWIPKYPYVCDEVTCTDTSTPDGGVIIGWQWSITGPATNTTAMDQSVMKFHCDGAGAVNVTLTVFDSEGMNDTCSSLIEQSEKLGCILDVYTSPNRFCGQTTPFVGKGINQNCDALSPDVNVTLFADVSWNGKPVNHVLVAFEVLENSTGELRCVLYRTAETDKDGIAKIWFRVPTPCEGQLFGKWVVIATAKIQEVKQEDWMWFDVGYVITQLDVMVDKETYMAPCDWITVTVKLKNIMWIEKHVTLVAVAYDDCDVPIGQCIVDIVIPPGAFCNPWIGYITIVEAIHVPQWTYIGLGKLYISAFTALPRLCGVAYCPEVSTTFKLDWRGYWP